jgi:hypothetical protein
MEALILLQKFSKQRFILNSELFISLLLFCHLYDFILKLVYLLLELMILVFEVDYVFNFFFVSSDCFVVLFDELVSVLLLLQNSCDLFIVFCQLSSEVFDSVPEVQFFHGDLHTI